MMICQRSSVFVCFSLLPCIFALSLPPPALNIISPLTPNVTIASHPAISNLTTRHLPANNYIFYIPSTPLAISFSNYDVSISKAAVHRAITKARADFAFHELNSPMEPHRKRYEDDERGTALWFFPGQMMWEQWELVLQGLEVFVKLWDAVALRFDVFDVVRESRVMGYGFLSPSW